MSLRRCGSQTELEYSSLDRIRYICKIDVAVSPDNSLGCDGQKLGIGMTWQVPETFRVSGWNFAPHDRGLQTFRPYIAIGNDLSGRYTVRCNRADIDVRVSSYNDIEP